jgi:hypothetical protein
MGLGSGGTSRAGKNGANKYATHDIQNVNNKANEDLINFLEHKLEEIEKKLQRT